MCPNQNYTINSDTFVYCTYVSTLWKFFFSPVVTTDLVLIKKLQLSANEILFETINTIYKHAETLRIDSNVRDNQVQYHVKIVLHSKKK